MQTIQILVIDHRPLIGRGVSLLLNTYPGFQVIGQAQSTPEALKQMEFQAVDVVLIDVDMPGSHGGIEAIAALRQASPYTRIIVLTNLLEAATIHQALRAGAISYLLKNVSLDELAEAVRAAYRGIPTLSSEATSMLVRRVAMPAHSSRSLTAREQQVLDLMSRGLNNHQIASELHISLSTVQFHVSNILAKLGAHNRTEAATLAIRRRFDEGGTA
jgi:DNA-binding NarL/FixJ family response regulator